MRSKILVFVFALLLLPPQQASAQSFFDSQSIIGQLVPQNTGPTVRSMSSVAKRGINIQGPLPPTVDLPSVSLTVNFDLGSANLTTDGMIALRSLAKALLDPRLARMTFQVVGHTDGRGDVAYNQTLSERRAQTVVEHLTSFYEVPASQLIPLGYGISRPMDPTNIMNPLNRRVEIINLEPLS
ncbi:OmpA family protein [uncultured Roseobacter sp.]|uniref:OmpA family protein n=1 Tax=uncultured Roseobacter sp. TaxID=114847 RepID=UPI0034458BE0